MLALFAALLLITPTDLSRTIDDFEGPLNWQAIASEGVEMKLTLEPGKVGRALRIDYDFRGRGGFALAQLDLNIDLPENYAFDFWLKADSPNNNFEFKLMDPSGENVWWRNQIDFTFPTEWTSQTIRKRHIGFAWGPQGGGEITRLGSLQFGVAAFTGGKGTLWIDGFRFRALDPPLKDLPTPRANASISAPGSSPEAPLLGHEGEWRVPSGRSATYTVDFGAMRELGGLTLIWGPDAAPRRYAIELSTDGEAWDRMVDTPTNGGRDDVRLPDAEARALRLVLPEGGPEAALRRIRIQDVGFGASENAMWSMVAAESRRGQFPRSMLGEQTYFTVIGSNGGASEALLSEDGQLEVEKRGPSLEPFVVASDKVLTWADGRTKHSLRHNWMPIPKVTRTTDEVELSIEAIPDDQGEAVVVTYTLHNLTNSSREDELLVALRPFSVNPPWQNLNMHGGFARVQRIEAKGGEVGLPDGTRIYAPVNAEPFRGGPVWQDEIGARIMAGDLPPTAGVVEDPAGAASGVWRIPMHLGPRMAQTVRFVIARPGHEARGEELASAILADGFGEAPWAAMLGDIEVRVPQAVQRYLDVWKSNLAYVLVNRDRDGIQPGSRCYERSWIRDGSLTGAALLRAGRFEEVRRFLRWYAQYLPETGYVPCIVDHRGAEPVPQHDAHGQWIFAIAEYFRFTGDIAMVREFYPTVRRTVAFLDRLRNERRTAEFQSGDKRVFYGLVPESMSHEGYAAKPMHSYWDNFFVVKGLKDATFLARVLGEHADASAWDDFRAEFQRDFYASVLLAMEQRQVEFIPGCAELGDFDATSTSIGLYPCGEYDAMPQQARDATFDRYWRFFTDRRDGIAPWDGLTPYELRIVNSMLILGRPEDAHAIIDWFFGHLRPSGWNHWAEVVWNDLRRPAFIGDMPHTWVGSEWIKAFRNLFYLEREDGSVQVGAGVPSAWLAEGEAIEWRALPTFGGRVNLRWTPTSGNVRVTVEGPQATRGVILPPMGAAGDPVAFESLPATADFALPRAR